MLKFFSLVAALSIQDLQERFAGSFLGGLWVFIWPVVQLFIYIIIFGRLMGARLGMSGEVYAYGLYIASGLLCWTAFAASLNRSTRAFIDRRHIITKVPVNLAVFPAALCLVELLPFAAGFALLFAADLITGWRPDFLAFLLVLAAIYIQISLCFGLGLLFACIAVFMRDMAEACAIALQMAFWFTPIVYLPSILPHWLQKLLWLNPMSGITGIFQQFFVLGGSPDWLSLIYAFIFGQLALGAGIWSLHRWRKDIRDVI